MELEPPSLVIDKADQCVLIQVQRNRRAALDENPFVPADESSWLALGTPNVLKDVFPIDQRDAKYGGLDGRRVKCRRPVGQLSFRPY
jgi:hypothetical protein